MLLKLILCSTLLSCVDLYGQADYARFVGPGKRGERQRIDVGDGGSEEVVYLGTIHDKNGQTLYHVLSVFRLVQAAIVKHGHPEVIVLDNSLALLKKYSLGLPAELPFFLKNNSLSFYYADAKTQARKVFLNVIGEQLPEHLCVSPNICY